MPGTEEIGAITVIWGVTTLIFREWVLRLDLLVRERVIGLAASEAAVEQQRRLLEMAGRGLLAGGLVMFAAGVAFRLAGAG